MTNFLIDITTTDKMLDLLRFVLAFGIPCGTVLAGTKIVAREFLQGQAAMKLRQHEITKLAESDEEIITRLDNLQLKVGGMEEKTAINRETLLELKKDLKDMQADMRNGYGDNHGRARH